MLTHGSVRENFMENITALFKLLTSDWHLILAGISIIILSIAVGLFIFYLIQLIFAKNALKRKQLEEEKLKPREDTKLDEWLKTKQTGVFSYRRIQELLLSTGEVYRTTSKGKLPPRPSDYIQDCIVLGIVGGLATVGTVCAFTMKFTPAYLLLAIPGFIGFFNFSKYSMSSTDKKDNVKMLSDINSMYEALKVSATAGIPMVDGLAECYRQVKHPRLKKAMSEVSNAIHGGKDMEAAINHLRAQFTSPEITQFCIVIRQSLETGRQEEILSDLSANMRDVQNEINHKIEESLNTKVQMIQMSLLFILIFSMLYATMSTLSAQFGAF